MDYPKRLRPDNINSAEYWEEIWKKEGQAATRRIDPDRFANMASLLNRDESVLDVAGGMGEFLVFLRTVGFTNTLGLVEQSDYAVARARAMSFEGYRGSVYGLPFASKSWDAVTLGEVIEHIDDPAQAVTEAARVARRCVVLSTPYLTVLNGDPEHVWAWDLDSISRLLEPHGRVRITMTTEDPGQYHGFRYQIIVAGAFRE